LGLGLDWGWGWGWQAAISAHAPELVIQYSELRLGGVVAEGGSGVVVKGHFGAAPIVAKSVRSQFMEGDFDEIQREMAMLYRLRHSGLTTFYGVCFHDSALMLIQVRRRHPCRPAVLFVAGLTVALPARALLLQEFCPQTLEAMVRDAAGGPGLMGQPEAFFRVAGELAETLVFLHDRAVAHRDLKVGSERNRNRTGVWRWLLPG
jgi:serine/threonine protein kinase